MLWSFFVALFLQGIIDKNVQTTLFWMYFAVTCIILMFVLDLTFLETLEKYLIKIRGLLRERMMSKLTDDELAHTIISQKGGLVSWFFNDHTKIIDGITSFFKWAYSLSAITTIVVVLLFYNLWVALVTSICMFLFAIPSFLRKYLVKYTVEAIKINEAQSTALDNHIKGGDVLISSNKTEVFIRRFQNLQQGFVKKLRNLNFKEDVISTLMSSFGSTFQVFTYIVVAILVSNKKIEVASISIILSYSGMGMGELYNVVFGPSSFFAAKELMKKFSMSHPQISTHQIEPLKDLIFQDVDFKHDDSGEWVFKDFSFVFREGKYAIVGRSGAGKSTLAFLVLKLLSPSKGKILWNKNNLKNISSKALNTRVNFIPPHPPVFKTTLRNNLTLWDNNISQEELEKVVKIVNLKHINLEKVISMNTVSAGEKQKIAIARALLFPKDILVMDESLSSIDSFARTIIKKHILTAYKVVIHLTHHLEKEQQDYDYVINVEGTSYL